MLHSTILFQAFLNSNMTEHCEHRGSRHRWKSTQSLHYDTLKKSNTAKSSNLAYKSKFMSLNGSPNKINHNHVRFTPDTKDDQTIIDGNCPKNYKIEMVHCRLLTTEEVFKAVKRSPVKIMIKKTN